MFTIVENYKALIKMCVSASMSVEGPNTPDAPTFRGEVQEVR